MHTRNLLAQPSQSPTLQLYSMSASADCQSAAVAGGQSMPRCWSALHAMASRQRRASCLLIACHVFARLIPAPLRGADVWYLLRKWPANHVLATAADSSAAASRIVRLHPLS